MKSITRKGDIREQVNFCLQEVQGGTMASLAGQLNNRLLNAKIKFPLLEFAATLLVDEVPYSDQIRLCDEIQKFHTIGGNVLIGILLQKRLAKSFQQSIRAAAKYIAAGEEWYVTDIIGERVYGWSLLHEPEKTIPELTRLSHHKSTWVVRSLGAGAHYAIKKGLDTKHVGAVFELLLSLSDTTDFHVKTGIGWAAKTTAKFHPQIIEQYRRQLGSEQVPAWFRKKIDIGLERNAYVKKR